MYGEATFELATAAGAGKVVVADGRTVFGMGDTLIPLIRQLLGELRTAQSFVLANVDRQLLVPHGELHILLVLVRLLLRTEEL